MTAISSFDLPSPNPFGDLLLAGAEMILEKRTLVLDLFVDQQQKTARTWTATKTHRQLTNLRWRRSIAAETSNFPLSSVHEGVGPRDHGEV